MELRIPVQELTRHLNLVQGVVPRKNTMPILGHVLLEANTDEKGMGSLSISATDLDISLRTIHSCEVLQNGAITIGAKSLFDIVKVLSGPDVTIKRLENQHIEVKCGATKARLVALSSEEYPRLPDVDDIETITLEVSSFFDMVQKTIYCASTDESRYNLTGVYFDPDKEIKNRLRLISTDGHRLSFVEKDFEDVDFSKFNSIILPRKGLVELQKILSDDSSKTNIFNLGFDGNQAIIKRGSTILTMRLVDGVFPDYKQVIPTITDKIINTSKEDFLNSLKRVSVLASDKGQGAKLVINDSNIILSCNNPDTGEISDDLSVEYNGPSVEIAFNAKYLADSLSSLEDGNLLLKMTDSLSPGLLVGEKDQCHLCVIMPMRL